MKLSSLALAAFTIILFGAPAGARAQAPAAATASAAPDAAIMARAKEWLHRLQTADIDRTQLSAQMNGVLNPDSARQFAAQISVLGDPTSFTFVSKQTSDAGTAYTYRVEFKGAAVNEVLTLGNDGKISGLLLSPAAAQPGTPVPTALPTPFPHFRSTDVTFTSSDGTRLAGTLTVPNGGHAPFTIVVLVHGSGPLDRNETIGPNAIFLQLSNALSNAGYAVLRYDKRGVGKSGGSAATRTRTDLLEDIRAAMRFARSYPSINPKRIFLLGHSEGGELVPSAAAADGKVSGIILMAPPALPLWQVSMQQALASVPASQREATRQQELQALDQIRTGQKQIPGGAWYRSSMDIDPVVDIARVRGPILILQGASDAEVLPGDLPRLVYAARKNNRDVAVFSFPGDNHLFMTVHGSTPQTPQAAVQQYLTLPARIDPAVLRTIVGWLKRHP